MAAGHTPKAGALMAMALAPAVRVVGVAPGLTLTSNLLTPEQFEAAGVRSDARAEQLEVAQFIALANVPQVAADDAPQG